MKTTTLLTLAATVGGSLATFGGFRGAPAFNCPENIDNKCDDKQKGGFDWLDLSVGKFDRYNDFDFKGWECRDRRGRRDISSRTFGGKSISGVCGPDKRNSPSFGCDTKGVTKQFSIIQFDISVEFDCDLEFHYDMPDGKICKHRSPCSRAGTTVKNSQCGGAKNVTVIYPPQPKLPKTKCGVDIHTVKFDCEPPVPPVPPRTTTTKTTSTDKTTLATISSSSTTSSPAPPVAQTTETTFLSTSTIFTTVVSTLTSCAPTVPNCPAAGKTDVTVVTMTVPLTTTVCPVTETITKTPEQTKTPEKPQTESDKKPEQPTTTAPTAVEIPPSQPPKPIETLPCPPVVPSCLNTWMFSIACNDNTDIGCFCPDALFVQNVFTCIYAHGETDIIISQAVVFFQGICAPYVPQNPAIVTAAETVTAVVTVTAEPTVAASYTTVVVTATTVVPCETDGTTIPGSSTTKVIETSVTLPQVDFQTGTDSSVNVIPAQTPIVPVPAPVAPPTTRAPGPTGTGRPLPTTTSRPAFQGAATKVNSDLGLGLVIAAAIALL